MAGNPSHPPTLTFTHTLPKKQQNHRVELGAMEEWVLTEARTGPDAGAIEDVNHPFHIHVNHFQECSSCCFLKCW